MKRGDIYMVALDPALGHEQQVHRPILIVSPTEFNKRTKLPVILPITNGGALTRKTGFAVPLSGTRTIGFVRCDQPRVLDLAARNGRLVESIPNDLLDDVLARVVTIFE